MSIAHSVDAKYEIKEPKGLSERIRRLRDYYFKGAERKWNNEFTSWTTGTAWDVQFPEFTFYIVPETYLLLPALRASYAQAARPVRLHDSFWKWSLPERRAWFVKEVVVNYLPQEILPGDLIAGARFNIMTSLCLTKKEQKKWDKMTLGKNGARRKLINFHNRGYGNAGATSGHLIPNHEHALNVGWSGIFEELQSHFDALSKHEQKGEKGAQLQAMMTAATMPRALATRYAAECKKLAGKERDQERKTELMMMAANLEKIGWHPPETFWEAVQALWLNHMLIMSDENYPGPGISFGRIDQFLLPYWERSMKEGMDIEWGKEILKCFWVHANTAYDAQIKSGNQGITAGFGQLLTLSGVGENGQDMTNDLTYAILEVIDEMSPILEPKPNVRLHRNTPEKLLDKIVDMIASSQGAPFLLNFDERSLAGMLRQSKLGGMENLIHEKNVHEYAPVGCLENTMVGNDRSGTVDNNLNLIKAVELALTNGSDLNAPIDPVSGSKLPIESVAPKTGEANRFERFEDFWRAFARQMRFIVSRCVEVHEASESLRADLFRTPYLSCLVKGCAEKAKDITNAGAQINFTTLEAVTFATTVDSLLAIKYLVFDNHETTLTELLEALRNNWQGFEILQAKAKNKAPKYGQDDDEADEMALRVMQLWTDETWRHQTRSTKRQYRPGMLSWNYWAGDGFIVSATPDGRAQGQFLSNAICPTNGADKNGPTGNTNSVGKALGGRQEKGDFEDFVNLLPNGASHTITFNPSLLKDPEHRAKFKAFLKAYVENGGTALQINMLDPEMLKDAQKHPQDYRHLLVRVTGYNAYFTSIGRELQNEVIARISHNDF